jgi:dihydropyrimidinase
MTVHGVAATTISQGKVVWSNGKLSSVRGAGRYIPRPCFAPYWHSQIRRNELAAPVGIERRQAAE